MNRPTLAPLLLLTLWALAQAGAPALAGQGARTLQAEIHRILTTHPSLRQARVGALVQVTRTGRIVYSRRSATPMVPASNLKVLTTAAALDLLGPDHRYQTDLLGAPVRPDGTLPGDLYLKGSGDPSMVPPYVETAEEPLRFFARQLCLQGVRRIAGAVVADDSVFDRQFLGHGWLQRYRLDGYAAPVAGLSLNGNLVELAIRADGVEACPPSLGLQIVHQPEGSGGEVWVDRPPGSNTITVRGCPAPGRTERRTLTVENPPLFAAGALAWILRREGLEAPGGIRLIHPVGEPALVETLKRYARYESPPLRELIELVNRESDNLFADHLFRTLGARTRGVGSARTGQEAVAAFLNRAGLDAGTLRMVDGCGLSPLNRATPQQLVGALVAMDRHPHREIFLHSLPGPGQGTLTHRLGGVPTRAKTGTLAEDSALSGFVTTAAGQRLAFSLVFNRVPGIWSAVEAQDRIVLLLASWTQPL